MAKVQSLHYASAALAVLGTIGYHNLLKKIPDTIDPMVSIMAIYLGVLFSGMVLLPFGLSCGRMWESVQQLGWVQCGISVCILMMEIGFLLMYRNGWELSIGNVVTGVFINIGLMTVGVVFLGEKLSVLNATGVLACILGVSLIEI
jgi:drug/metabolite transporter (DMT)-like permease